jgi:hypothetical protein
MARPRSARANTNIEVAIALLLGPRMYGHFLKLMNRHLPDYRS